MKIAVESTGWDELLSLLDDLANPRAAASVARTAVSAGMRVVRSAGVRASPGRVKLEWGSVLSMSGASAVGRVGLGVGGYRASVKRPHGKYLNDGTPYITARHFVQQSFVSSAQRAEAAMRRAARWRIAKLINPT